MEALTVYTTGPQCGKCRMTKMILDSKGIPYVEVNITCLLYTSDAADEL